MRGSVIEYVQTSQLLPGYMKTIRDIVWGTTTDNDSRDILEIGKFGCNGYIPLSAVEGVELTESILIDYGFIRINEVSDCITYFRDDFGYAKLDTYGIEHVYMKGKCIKYLHNFQRVFLDYTGHILYPKVSEKPKQEWKSSYVKTKEISADEILKGIEEIKNVGAIIDSSSINIDFKF